MSLLNDIEAKVKASSLASFAVGVALALLNDVQNDHALLGSVSAPVQAVVLMVAPPLATFLAGWATKHTPRNAGTSEDDQPVKG